MLLFKVFLVTRYLMNFAQKMPQSNDLPYWRVTFDLFTSHGSYLNLICLLSNPTTIKRDNIDLAISCRLALMMSSWMQFDIESKTYIMQKCNSIAAISQCSLRLIDPNMKSTFDDASLYSSCSPRTSYVLPHLSRLPRFHLPSPNHSPGHSQKFLLHSRWHLVETRSEIYN